MNERRSSLLQCITSCTSIRGKLGNLSTWLSEALFTFAGRGGESRVRLKELESLLPPLEHFFWYLFICLMISHILNFISDFSSAISNRRMPTIIYS